MAHGTIHGGHQGGICQPGLIPALPGAGMFHVLHHFASFLAEAFLPFLLNQSMKKLVTRSVEIGLH